MPSWALPLMKKKGAAAPDAAAPAAPATEAPAVDVTPDVKPDVEPQSTDIEKPPVAPAAPAEPAPERVGSTYERASFRAQSTLRLSFGSIYWLIFMALNVFEIQNDYRMNWRLRKVRWNRQLYPVKKGEYGIQRERKFIWFAWGLHIGAVICFALTACSFMIFRQVRALKTMTPQGRSRGRWLVWGAVLAAIATDFMKLYALGSVLNKLRYIDQWCPGTSAHSDFKYTLSSGGGKHGSMDCKPHKATDLIRWSVVYAVINTLFNTFIFFTKQPKGMLTKVLSAIPAAILTVMLYIKPLTSMMLLHYAQRRYTSRGDMSYRSEAIVALIAQVTALLFSLQMAYVITDLHLFTVATNRLFHSCGVKTHSNSAFHSGNRKPAPSEPSTKDLAPGSAAVVTAPAAAPPPPPSLRNTFKILVAQWFYVGQLPIAFNLLAPILVIVSLRIWNFWIGLDFILGLALFILYLICLVFHKFLFPQWQL